MSTRETTVSTSISGTNKTYPAGAAATTAASTIVNQSISKDSEKSANSLLGKNGAFNGHVVEIWADGAVYDTSSGTYLFPGRDYNPSDHQRK